MIELSTGVAFLVSSMYGATSPALSATAVNSQAFAFEPAPKVVIQDPQSVQNYLTTEFADTPILVQVARCESQFRQFDSKGNLLHGTVDYQDVGVMQINEKYHGPEAKAMGLDLTTIEGNVAYAKHLYAKEGTAPWKASAPCWQASSDLTINK